MHSVFPRLAHKCGNKRLMMNTRFLGILLQCKECGTWNQVKLSYICKPSLAIYFIYKSVCQYVCWLFSPSDGIPSFWSGGMFEKFQKL